MLRQLPIARSYAIPSLVDVCDNQISLQEKGILSFGLNVSEFLETETESLYLLCFFSIKSVQSVCIIHPVGKCWMDLGR